MGKYVTIKRNGVYSYAFDIENTPLECMSIQELDEILSPYLGEICNYVIETHSELPVECVNQIKEFKEKFEKDLAQFNTLAFENYLSSNDIEFIYELKFSKWYRFKRWLFGKKE